MITFYFDNILLFIPQYVFATLVAALIYYYLGQKLPWSHGAIPRLRRTWKLGSNEFHSPLSVSLSSGELFLRLDPPDFGLSLKNFYTRGKLFFDALYYNTQNGYPDKYYQQLATKYSAPHLFEERITYQMYRIMVAVSAWAGLLLVVTPFSYIYVFIPHFQNPYNIIVAIILAISIFEGVISTIFFRVGVSYTRVALVEALVILTFTFSILSPSMSWLSLFTTEGKLIIYLILLFLFTTITALISQLKTRRNLFASSLLFATLSYFSFSAIVLINVLEIVLA